MIFLSVYYVTREGDVWNTKTGKILRNSIDRKTGFLHVGLYLKGRRVFKYVHRLVAERYLPNPKNCKYIGFKDGDKTNCRVDNLYWKEDYNE